VASLTVLYSVLVNPSAIPRFWTFMYHISPMTYFVSAIMSTGTAGVSIACSTAEILTFDPPTPQSCAQYLADYLQSTGGNLLNPDALRQCQLCPMSSTDDVLALLGIDYADRWRNFGITCAYSVVNVLGALALYWLLRVPKGPKRS
jgi:ATP-binding cassette, subfamily G (WHITE), member 2, PDR